MSRQRLDKNERKAAIVILSICCFSLSLLTISPLTECRRSRLCVCFKFTAVSQIWLSSAKLHLPLVVASSLASAALNTISLCTFILLHSANKSWQLLPDIVGVKEGMDQASHFRTIMQLGSDSPVMLLASPLMKMAALRVSLGSGKSYGFNCLFLQNLPFPSLLAIQEIIYYNYSFQIRMQITQKQIVVWAVFLTVTRSATYSREICSAREIFDSSRLSCVECPAGMRPNPQQSVATSCSCDRGYYPLSATACSYLGANSSISCGSDQYFPVLNDLGQYGIGASSYLCSPCDLAARSNANGTACIPCPRNMRYSVSESICICTSGIETSQGCFTSAETDATANLGMPTSKYYNSLKYLFPSCAYYKDSLSCSELVNLCTYSMAHGDATQQAECKFFDSIASARYYHQFDPAASQFYISPGKFAKNQEMKVRLLYYSPTGNLIKEKEMRLPDLLRCGMPSDNSLTIKLGNNIQVSCSFNFDYLVQQSLTSTYQGYVFEAFIAGEGGAYFPVAVYIGSATTPVRRFFLEDLTTSSTYMHVLNNLKLTFSLNSTGYLVSPLLRVSYKKLSIQGSKVAPTADRNQVLNYEVKFVYDLQTFWTPFIAIFITINVVVLIQSIARTYIAHLNKQSVLSFFYFLASFWSLWMFYFLIAVSGYWFLFCKTTQDVYIFIPDSATDIFYVAFFVIAGIMGLFRVLTVFLDKKDKLNYEVFLINWEKGRNSWRQIFIINSLAEFYTHRTISFFWMLLCVLFFLVGLKWQSHAAEVAHTTLSSVYYFNPLNRVFLYFLGSTIFLIIGIIFKIFRRLSVFKWPYPFEDFVDYCNVANVSLFFMKKRSQEAYYIHASIPHRVEVSYREINNAIRVGLNKERGIIKEYSFHPGQHVYQVYLCKQLEEKFLNMLKKTEQDQQEQLVTHSKKNAERKRKNKNANPREEFIQSKLKPYLDQIGRQGSRTERTLIRRLFGIPEIDLRDPASLRTKNMVLNDENLDIVADVFPNGNEFEEIHNVIILFLMFLLMTANVCAAALITYFVSEYIMDKLVSVVCRSRLEKMTKVKEGFML